jgi:enterochelin esterase-like enzyme
MKNMLLIFAGLMLMFSTSYSQTGKVFDDLSIPSKILGGERKYAVYLPPCYESSNRSYPVLYLLHGAGDDQSGWIQFGEVLHITDKAIREGTATPMIIIMPDANTGQRGYFNDISGKWRYEDFFFDELIPFVEKNTVSGVKNDSGQLPVFRWGVEVRSCTRSEGLNCSHRLALSARI